MLMLILAAQAAPGYLRYPDIHNETVVFSAEGDLWTAPTTGGLAHRLTSKSSEEVSPHFSPDGQSIAFTSTDDGNTDIYVVSTDGGTPRRLTWGAAPEDAVGWTPDGASVIFRGRGTDPNGVWRLYTVPAKGGDPVELPLGWAARIDMDPQSGLWAFTRLGRESATWKRYRGGSADDIWVGDPKKQDYHTVTSQTGPDAFPMWHQGRVFYLADQGGKQNLWSVKADGSDRQQHTHFTEWDVRWPSMGPDGRIVFMYAGGLQIFDPKDNSIKQPAINLPGEGKLSEVHYTDALSYLTAFDLAPDADRVVVTSRGELFSFPSDPGLSLPLTSSSGARESNATYSPDGKRVLYVTDASGEEAIVSADAWGRGDVKTLKAPGKSGWHFAPTWAPDSKKIAYADQTRSLYILSAEGGTPTLVDTSPRAEITEYVWSPDGRYLAYSRIDERDFSQIYLYDTKDGKIYKASAGNTSDASPAWDPDGRYLYFVSSRYVDPIIGDRDFQTVLMHSNMLCALLLRSDVPNPFAENAGLPPAPLNTAAQAAAEKSKKEKKKKDKKQKELEIDPTLQALTPITIETTGLAERLVVLPIEPGNYTGLGATSSRVFFLSVPSSGMNPAVGFLPSLWAYDLESRSPSIYMDGIFAYSLQAKAEKMALLSMMGLYVFPTSGQPSPEEWERHRIPLENTAITIDPRQEWRQIYMEAWRFQRDFFWDADMGGLDWPKIRDQYATLLDRIATRDDLNDVIGEMIGELGTSHTYVGGGDYGYWSWGIGVGSLGADVSREGDAFKITRILHGDQADNQPSPLLEPGVGIKEGEYILAINNEPVRADQPLAAMLQGLAGKRVMLTIGPKPTREGSRYVVITPLWDESGLRHADQVRLNREYVSEKTKGKVGYLHIPDMGAAGLVAFETWFYPQADKDGLIIDVRYNRGGFVSQLILEKLRRPIDGWVVTRYGVDGPYPMSRRRGPFVVLTNEFAGSDGDIFPRAVQIEGLAPVIGMRSWGGVIGIRADKPAIDFGFLSQPEFAFFFKQGGWSVENRGVVPDIEVPLLPQDAAAGRDPQLDRAITEVMQRIQAQPLNPTLDPKPKKTQEVFEQREK